MPKYTSRADLFGVTLWCPGETAAQADRIAAIIHGIVLDEQPASLRDLALALRTAGAYLIWHPGENEEHDSWTIHVLAGSWMGARAMESP